MTSPRVSALSFSWSAARDGFQLLALFGLLAPLGCGDASSARDAITVDSGVAPDKPVVLLTEQEARILCEATIEAADAIYPLDSKLTLTCSAAAAALSIVQRPDGELQIDRESCERSRDECLASARAAQPVESGSCGPSTPALAQASTCTATVAEYEDCLTATLYAAADAFEKIDCAYLATQPVKSALFQTSSGRSTDVPECKHIVATCGAPPAL